MIRDLSNLAGHLGTDPTIEAVARRLYRGTTSGVSFSVSTTPGPASRVRYTVALSPSIVGWRVRSWRRRGGSRCYDKMPPALAEYMEANARGIVPYNPAGIDLAHIVKRSVARGTVFLTVDIEQHKDLPCVVVSGYVEGDVGDCPNRVLAFPFTVDQFDTLVAAADADADNLWNETHGCEKCGSGDEPHPVDPDCPACGGHGIPI